MEWSNCLGCTHDLRTERESIRSVIEGFYSTGVVDEVIVVDNNSEPGTLDEVALTPARCVTEVRQGYGFASRRGLAEARGDLIILAEPDGTFLAADIHKLLPFSDECDAVFGTRTNGHLIWQDANMGPFLKWGNWAVAKLVRVLFRSAHLSDVGCTYRLLTRDAVEIVLPQLRIGGSQLGPELILRTITSGLRFVEVPVNYLPRVGTSSVTGEFWKALILGMQMIALILRMRLATIGRTAHVSALTLGEDNELVRNTADRPARPLSQISGALATFDTEPAMGMRSRYAEWEHAENLAG